MATRRTAKGLAPAEKPTCGGAPLPAMAIERHQFVSYGKLRVMKLPPVSRIFLVGFLLFSGCHGKSPKLNQNDQTAFNQAPPEVKQFWDKALEADKANDYAAAETLLYKLLSLQLTPEQRGAVEKELTSVNQRLFA